MLKLNKLTKIAGHKSKKKRVGRGAGSGKGFHTAGKGMKGQKSRAGAKPKLGFEGGQTPLYMKLPKIGGFNNKNKKKYVSITTDHLSKLRSGSKVSPQVLVENKIIEKVPSYGVKIILGKEEITKKYTLENFKYSESAHKALTDSGSTIK
jgi:large subunit ribosomal protein L15